MTFAAGLPPGAIEVERIGKLRAKRKFEASLPPLSDMRMLPVRQQMMEDWENAEWEERGAEIKAVQDERLLLLEQAILARETELEEGHTERVQAVTKRLLAGKAVCLFKAVILFSRKNKGEKSKKTTYINQCR